MKAKTGVVGIILDGVGYRAEADGNPMKTAKMQQAAQEYIDGQGLVLTAQNDRFLHTTRTERYIEPPKSSGGTSVNSSGSSHSSGRF